MTGSGFGWKPSAISPGRLLPLITLFVLPVLVPSLLGWITGLLATPIFLSLSINGFTGGKKYIVISLLVAGTGAVLLGQVEMFLFSLTLLPLGVILFKSAEAKDAAATSGAKGTAALVVTWLLFWTIYGLATTINPYSHLLKSIDLGLQQTLELAGSKDAGLPPEMVLALNQATVIMRETIPRMLPGLLLTMTILTVWFNMVLINSITGGMTGTAPWGTFKEWRLPEPLVWVIAGAIALVLFTGEELQDIGFWVLMVTGTLYFFQGMAVLVSLLERWRIPPFFRMVVYVIFILQTYGLIVIAALGLLEVWCNFRKNNESNA